jgi:hypothetical protein
VQKDTKKKKRKKKRERTATENGIDRTDHYGSFGILLEYGDSEK